MSDLPPGTHHQRSLDQTPSAVSPSSPSTNKAATRTAATSTFTVPPPTLAQRSNSHPHASASVGSAASAIDSNSELTWSSGDSLPAQSSSQKTPRHPRRPKQQKGQPKWTKGAVSSDDTGSDRKPSLSSPSKTSSSPAVQHSPRPNWTPNNRQRSHSGQSANHNAGAHKGRSMAANFGSASGDSRRGVSSPRPKGRGMRFRSCRVPCQV